MFKTSWYKFTTTLCHIEKEGASGFEPETSRSAVECSTTELYPQLVEARRTGEVVPGHSSGIM